MKNVENESESKKSSPDFGDLKLRGRIFKGIVVKSSVPKMATVEWFYRIYLSKYERYENRRSRVKAHIPDGIEINVGDNVTIAECRPISKTKNFVIISKDETNKR